MKSVVRVCALLWILGTCVTSAVSDEYYEHEWRKTERFVTKAAEYFTAHPLFAACHDFVTQVQWNGSARMLFVLDAHNRILVFDRKLSMIWRPFSGINAFTETPFLQELRIRAQDARGGWVNGEWFGALVHAYAREVNKDGDRYLIGALCFSWSPRAQIEVLVEKTRTAVLRYRPHELVQRVSNPRGDFVRGTYGVYLFSREGICVANPFVTEIIGKNITAWVDDTGKSIFSRYQEALTTQGSSGWCSYSLNGEMKKEFVALVGDLLCVAGYYPLCDEAYVKKFLAEAIAQGTTQGLRVLYDFEHPFQKMGLSIIVYDEAGTVLADSGFPALVGTNNMSMRDEQLHYRTKEIIEHIKEQGSGFIVTTVHGAPMLLYGERVEKDDATHYYVVRGYTSCDRVYTAMALSEEIADYIKNAQGLSVFRDIAHLPERLLRGGLIVEVYDAEDYCLFSTLAQVRLWKRLKRPFPARGWIMRTLKNGTYRCFIQMVEKEGHGQFVVCVGYHE